MRERSAERRQRTVLFLMANAGGGHRSAATAIARAMRLADASDWRAVIVDGVTECGRFPFPQTISLYGPVTNRSPHLFGRLFHLTNTPAQVRIGRRLCRPLLCPGLRTLLARVRPDVIVSTHFFFHHMVPMALEELGVAVPLVAVVTDLYTVHHAWAAPGADVWIAPSDVARDFLLSHGVEQERIHLLGLPIDPAFSAEPAGSRAERRAALGLDPDLPVVLLTGGGEGVGGLRQAARALVRGTLPAQLVIITGRNRALYQELLTARNRSRMPARIEGFVTNMPEWMRAADVIVTKAGPGTIMEAMACGLPMILTGAVPGQEEGNLTYVLEHELGQLATTPAELLASLERLLRPGSAELERLAANARRLSRPLAAAESARLVLSYLPPPDAPSPWEHISPPGARLKVG